jgi:hypothetical protein
VSIITSGGFDFFRAGGVKAICRRDAAYLYHTAERQSHEIRARPSRFAVRSRFDFVPLARQFLLHDKAQIVFIINYK